MYVDKAIEAILFLILLALAALSYWEGLYILAAICMILLSCAIFFIWDDGCGY